MDKDKIIQSAEDIFLGSCFHTTYVRDKTVLKPVVSLVNGSIKDAVSESIGDEGVNFALYQSDLERIWQSNIRPGADDTVAHWIIGSVSRWITIAFEDGEYENWVKTLASSHSVYYPTDSSVVDSDVLDRQNSYDELLRLYMGNPWWVYLLTLNIRWEETARRIHANLSGN